MKAILPSLFILLLAPVTSLQAVPATEPGPVVQPTPDKQSAPTTGWQPVPGAFGMTRWAKDVTPDKVLPEYPRPQLVRKDWRNLNGLWDYCLTAKDADKPTTFPGKILVPFPIEAPLSGVGKQLNAYPGRTYSNSRLWYRRPFDVPSSWKDRHVVLHFGAVDWEATVYLNGKLLGNHRGGYDAFSFDVTGALDPAGTNELLVAVWDPTFEGGYPRGKQVDHPEGIMYTPCTGIWQTVWLEPVAENHIESLRIIPDVDASAVSVTCAASPANHPAAAHHGQSPELVGQPRRILLQHVSRDVDDAERREKRDCDKSFFLRSTS